MKNTSAVNNFIYWFGCFRCFVIVIVVVTVSESISDELSFFMGIWRAFALKKLKFTAITLCEGQSLQLRNPNWLNLSRGTSWLIEWISSWMESDFIEFSQIQTRMEKIICTHKHTHTSIYCWVIETHIPKKENKKKKNESSIALSVCEFLRTLCVCR